MNKLRRILIGIIILFLLFSLTKNLFDYQRSTQFYESYKTDYETAAKRNLELKTRILKSKDPNELEKTIRNRLNLTKEDEIAIMVPEPTKVPTTPTPTPRPNYRQWWDTFFGQ